MLDDRGRVAGQRTVTTYEASTDVGADYDELLHRRRSQRRNRAGALAAFAVVAVLAVLSVQAHLTTDPQPQPMQPAPGLDIRDVPVWYDDAGLHRGDIVEQTPVKVGRVDRNDGDMSGALALVRTGAVYVDPATDDVWFHPWGGDPRVVGHNSAAGPGGDPNGDTAAWFEGYVELVVYDTAAGREISRTKQAEVRDGSGIGGEHYPAGNGFLQVSAERVVWATESQRLVSFDLGTQTASMLKAPDNLYFLDVHDQVEAFGGRDLVVRVPGRAEARYPDLESNAARLSPSGSYVLAVEERNHDAAIIDIRTGELWLESKIDYPYIAWSYGNIALVEDENRLLACNASRRTCKLLPTEGPFLMPTN